MDNIIGLNKWIRAVISNETWERDQWLFFSKNGAVDGFAPYLRGIIQLNILMIEGKSKDKRLKIKGERLKKR